MTPHLDRPWLELDLGTPHRVLSWSLNRPGFVSARHILWREVRDADLTEAFDAVRWLRGELAGRGRSDAVAMLTSRDLGSFQSAEACVEGVTARCVATVGLSNAERVGTRLHRTARGPGTINLALCTSLPLGDAALIEALAIAAQARTAAIIDAGHALPTGIATGTGTDCIVVAAPPGQTAFAGMHTALGEALGRATYDAVRAGAVLWMDTVRRPAHPLTGALP